MRRLTLCFLLLLGLAGSRALACSCAMPDLICGPLGRPGSMLLGKVLRVQVVNNEHTMPDGTRLTGGGRRVFTVAVLEDFRNAGKANGEVEIETGMGGGDCGYDFKLNELYLIDAYEHDGRLSAGICGKTAPAAEATETLHELRQSLTGERLPDLSGSVIHHPTVGGSGAAMPSAVPNVPVIVTGADGSVITSKTDANGFYALATLAPGAYTVAFQLPPGLTTDDLTQQSVYVQIPRTDGTGAACHAALAVYTAGRLEGKVVDAEGQGIAGFVSVYGYPPAQQCFHSWSAASSIDKDGSFKLGPLDAGEYWLSFEPQGNGKQTWYYPGTLAASAATAIHVEEGKPVTGLVLHER